MSIDTIIAALLNKKRIGFEVGAIQAFGQELVRPGDQIFRLARASSPTSDLLKFTFEVNPAAGYDAPLAELVIEKPGEFKITETTLEISTANYVRFEEVALTTIGKDIVGTSRGKPGSTFPRPTGAALVLTKF